MREGSTPKFIIRKAGPEDRDRLTAAIEAVGSESDMDLYAQMNSDGLILPLATNIGLTLEMGKQYPEDLTMLVAQSGDQLVGLIQIDRDSSSRDKIARLSQVSVVKDFRDLGIGTRLLSEAEAWANAYKFKRLTLKVSERNKNAQRLYERYGFGITGLQESRPNHNKAEIVWIEMSKSVDANLYDKAT